MFPRGARVVSGAMIGGLVAASAVLGRDLFASLRS